MRDPTQGPLQPFRFIVVGLLGWLAVAANPVATVPDPSGVVERSRRFLVRFDGGAKAAEAWLAETLDSKMERLAPSQPYFAIDVPPSRESSIDDWKARLYSLPGFRWIQEDHPVHLRRTPQDPNYAAQWALDDIQAPDAWEIGTGGRNARGDEIVVAAIDSGMDLQHPDLVANLWVNPGEIPGNGVDEDQNGYVDDVHGWNAFDRNGWIPKGFHGTHIAGILGAVGNNHLHTSGVNWNVKLMPVAGASTRTSTVIQAYSYVMQQKKLWLSSAGRLGANVVVANSSFGIDRANCQSKDYPVWNELYDALGSLGILSVAATVNQDVDVDRIGDVPTGCRSDFLITVTNSNPSGEKTPGSGFGKNSIDIAAPGFQILSTVPGAGVAKLTGTSMSAPHVAGAVALMHALGSAAFSELAARDPRRAALHLKDLLLKRTEGLPAFDGWTLTGGKLDLAKSIRSIREFVDEAAEYDAVATGAQRSQLR
jgi:subtilisin family serine protease